MVMGKTASSKGSKGTRARRAEPAAKERLERNIKTPGERDILLGRGRTSWSHTGNQEFRAFVGTYLKKYTEAKNRADKTNTVHLIYDELIKSGGRFLKLDSATNTWYQVGKSIAREKIAHALRDAIGLRIKLNPDGEEAQKSKKNDKNAAGDAGSSTKSTSRKRNSSDTTKKQGSKVHSNSDAAFPSGTTSTEGILTNKSSSSSHHHHLPSYDGNDFDEEEKEFKSYDSFPSRAYHTPVHSNLQQPSAPQSMQPLPAGQNMESYDDELSTGFSAMSLESLRSGRSGKSSKTGRSRGSKKGAVFEFSSQQFMDGGNQFRMQQDNSFRSKPDTYDTAADMSVGGDSLEWIRGNCVGEGMSEIGSIGDFSLTSNKTGQSRNSNNFHGTSVGEMESISKGSSEKSTETEVEWHRTLRALRGV